jgi:hypothetical protein
LVSRIPYMYRDGANYKSASSIYLDGILTIDQAKRIEAVLEGGDGFIPFDLELDIDELQCNLTSFPCEDDHVFHEIDLAGIVALPASQVPAGVRLVDPVKFCEAFHKIGDPDRWRIALAEERLGLPSKEADQIKESD